MLSCEDNWKLVEIAFGKKIRKNLVCWCFNSKYLLQIFILFRENFRVTITHIQEIMNRLFINFVFGGGGALLIINQHANSVDTLVVPVTLLSFTV